jgi:hypothetical protein
MGWPSEGCLDWETIHRAYQVVTGSLGHLDQFPYINIWKSLAAHPLPWLKKYFDNNCKILMAKTMTTGTAKRKRKKRWLLNSEILTPSNLRGIPPFCQSKIQAPKITSQCKISEQSIKQQWLCTQWFHTHTLCWSWYQQKQPVSHVWT